MSAGGVHSTRLHVVNAAGLQSLLCRSLVSLLVARMLAYSWRQSTYLYRMLMRPTIMGAICGDTSHAFESGLQLWQNV